MRFGVVFVLAAAGLAALAVHHGGAAWLLLWPALAFGIVGVGYLGAGARVLGKRPDGTRPLWSLIVLLPYYALMRAGWLLLRALVREAPFHEVAPGLYVGRRCEADDLPEGTRVVVDMTAELTIPLGLNERARYVCVPTLDGHVPTEAAMRRLIDELTESEPPIYIHCAAGHGRSATAAAALLLARGDAASVDEAIDILRQARPLVRLLPRQRRLAARFAAR